MPILGGAAQIAKRLGMAGGALGALAGLTAGGLWYRLFRRPLPQTSGTLRVPGVEGRVEISRDRWGMPHVTAETEHDLWFAQGFCHGQDRLWQMDFYRRAAAGRIAEIAGPEGLPIDRFMRALGLRRIAEREEGEIGPGYRATLDAYCAGVNAAAEAARVLPLEFQVLRIDFEPWRPADMIAVAKLLGLGLSTNWERELLRADMVRELGEELTLRLDPPYPRGNPVVLDPGRPWSGDGLSLAEQIATVKRAIGLGVEASGSNNWAVSGERSRTGGPLLAGDPHLPPSMPGIWYQIELRLGERFQRGICPPGFAGVWFGQNNDVAWSLTNVMADVMDLFVERIDPNRAEFGAYEFEGEWRELETQIEQIEVKGRAPERVVVRRTHHGPIVNDFLGADDSEPLALRWSADDLPAVADNLIIGLRATSGEELVSGLATHNLPVSNIVWADRHGDIGYKMIGRIPIRRGGCPDVPKPGWTGEFEWDGYVPYEENPELRNPKSGFIVTANNRIAGDDFPHHITSDYLDGYRARRIEELIEASEQHDLAGFERMQVDVRSAPGLEVARRLARLRPPGQREAAAIERLRSWNGDMGTESVAATIYQSFTLRLAREFLRAAVRDRDLSKRWLDRAVNGFTAHNTSPWRWQSKLMELWAEGDAELVGQPWDALAMDALRGALDDLEESFGPEPEEWRWGDVHEMDFPHALGDANWLFALALSRSLRVGGGQETVSQIAYDPNEPFNALWAPSWRMVADPSNPDASRWQLFTGNSGHPGSEHYDDIMERWAAGLTQPMAGEGPWRELTLEPLNGAREGT